MSDVVEYLHRNKVKFYNFHLLQLNVFIPDMTHVAISSIYHVFTNSIVRRAATLPVFGIRCMIQMNIKNHVFDNCAIHGHHLPFVRRGSVFQIAIDSDTVWFVPP